MSRVAFLAGRFGLTADKDGRMPGYAPRIAMTALIVLLGARAAAFVSDVILQHPKAMVNPAAVGPAAAAGPDVNLIARANLFGEAALVDASQAQATSLSMVLAGVLASQDPQVGYAFLGPSAEAIRMHRINDDLPGGARLHSVYLDRVVLEHNGVLETLMLTKRASTAGLVDMPAAEIPPLVETTQPYAGQHPDNIGQVLRTQIVRANGRLQGYRVFPGTDAAAFESLGLRQGDVIVAINGVAFTAPSADGGLLQTLTAASTASVTVNRGGLQQSISLNVARATLAAN